MSSNTVPNVGDLVIAKTGKPHQHIGVVKAVSSAWRVTVVFPGMDGEKTHDLDADHLMALGLEDVIILAQESVNRNIPLFRAGMLR